MINNVFRIAVIGNYLNVKVQLINSFFGKNILSDSTYLNTAPVFEIKYGEEKKAVLHFKDRITGNLPLGMNEKIVEYIKKYNGSTEIPPIVFPYNQMNEYMSFNKSYYSVKLSAQCPYKKVELYWPLQFIKNNIELIYFPYLNMTNKDKNELMQILSKTDAALFVMNAQSLFSRLEMIFIDEVHKIHGSDKMVFAVKQLDGVIECNRQQILQCVQEKLERYTNNKLLFVPANTVSGSINTNSDVQELETVLTNLPKKVTGEPILDKSTSNTYNPFYVKPIIESIKKDVEYKPFEVNLHENPKSYYYRNNTHTYTKTDGNKDIKDTPNTAVNQKNATDFFYRYDIGKEDHKSHKSDTKNTNYFSWKNLNEIAEIDNHIEFAEDMVNKYTWEEEVKNRLYILLDQIKEKQSDDKLNLSVIGEFSTGKSTFINALIREDLLVANVLQGTTAASTIIEYGENYKITLYTNSEKKDEYLCKDLNELKKILSDYTTKEELAKNIKNVYVYLPSKTLKSGFRIIDTPGTNATTRWHEDVTIRTINEMSDASVILTNINQVLPKTTISFVKEHLSSVINQCIFIATKCDLVSKKEREQILSYMKTKISSEFNAKSPMVFPYASLDVLDDCTGEEEPDAELLKLSYSTEDSMMNYLSKRRSFVQTQKLIVLIEEMYDAISEQMDSAVDKRKQELILLSKFKQADLKSFAEEQKKQRKASFNNKYMNKRSEILKKLEEIKTQAQNTVFEEIDNKSSVEAINSFVSNGLSDFCIKASQPIISEVQKKNKEINTIFQDEIRVFQNEFKEKFRDLDIINIVVPANEISVSASINVNSNTITEANRYITEQISKDNKNILGGVAGGAAIGTAILPGIGTIAGAFIGGIVGTLFTEDVSNVRTNVKNKLKQPLNNYFDQVIYKCTDAIDAFLKNYTDSYKGFISIEIDKYLKAYGKIVDKRIAEEENKRKILETKIKKIEDDRVLMNNKKFILKSIGEQLNIANGKDD